MFQLSQNLRQLLLMVKFIRLNIIILIWLYLLVFE